MPKKDPTYNQPRKLPTRVRKIIRHLVPCLRPESPQKVAPKSIADSARSIGVRIPLIPPKIVVERYEKDQMEKSNFHTTNRGRKKPKSTKQTFTRLSKQLNKLKKAIKKQNATETNCLCSDNDSNLKLGIGSGSIGKIVINLGETNEKTKFTPQSNRWQ